ncbi:hypothetical protein D1AOALGA4SA_4501 [Olavius algarvensis Delta 1 endosymbiont]|nr:hypothetical protein D1AOALGA4SA_4501 [Olavius algarvensis Delta 1 endosymbiont]
MVFGNTLNTSYQNVIPLKTKHQILNTIVNRLFFDFLRDCRLSGLKRPFTEE